MFCIKYKYLSIRPSYPKDIEKMFTLQQWKNKNTLVYVRYFYKKLVVKFYNNLLKTIRIEINN